ncbi:tRNA pseudouridine(38-40) synthase TruA [Xylophilus sp. GOD-11R]|uniref:tRNA pseudouridine(38-40) synthase TruA n=1 Tax=Xylophilus sp. GOD-11R TaxID=3089814 RepID=UPI00298CB94E|nr:tRNA pseudouridine(38-40) synthase TruA [Xylophilus sp. GOD-11R]WPB55127.1 tRNA pseudouridine(38-40) synthase TruA [Xylophilus sp. GOD-11R]
MRIALGVAYDGRGYQGWQSQRSGLTVQDKLEAALSAFAAVPVQTVCAGRTDAGVHGLMQVVHVDTDVDRPPASWVRGTNRYLPPDIAVQWAQPVADDFHARFVATARRYAYVLLESPVRPSLESGRVGWAFRPLDGDAMRTAAAHLIGEHDFTSFRASSCQALSPVKTLHRADIARKGTAGSATAYWRFDFEGNAFLHHMVRNIMGCLVAVGQGGQSPDWMRDVIAARSRDAAAPTFAPDGLYFLGPVYDPRWGLPTRTPAYDWIP